MKKIIGIVNPVQVAFDEKSLETGCGGSETWAIEICKSFAKKENTHVICFCYCSKWHFTKEGVEYVPYKLFEQRCNTQHFDFMIISRTIDNALDIIKKTDCCHNIYMMLHDIILWEKAGIEPTDYAKHWINNTWRLNNVKKLLVLSDWHKLYVANNQHFPIDMMVNTANGLDIELIKECTNEVTEKDNSMLWSPRYERNFDLLVDKIAPLVIKEIPDFKVYACGYEDDLEKKYKDALSKDFVVNLGKLSKKDLYTEMSKHKCLFYPVIFPETFCISILEALMCGNMLVIANRYGPSTTLFPYKYFFFGENVDFYKDDIACEAAAQQIVKYIKEYDKPIYKSFLKSMQQYVAMNYNWDKITDDILKVVKENGKD